MAKVRKRGKNYFIDYRAYGKRYREVIGLSKKLAEDVLRKRLVEIAEGKFLDKKSIPTVKFEQFAQDYIEIYSKNNKKSWRDDETRIKALSAMFKGKDLSKITPLKVEQYKAMRIKSYVGRSNKRISPATVNRELACLKHMFTMAINWGKAEDNPVKKVKLFKEDNKRLRYLELNEIEALVGACEGYLKNIVIIALNTGMRRGEILNLKWSDIDFGNGIIYLLKTKNSKAREIPMNTAVKQSLIRQKRHKDSPYIFTNIHTGKKIGDIKTSFLAVLRKLDIMNFRFHDLRHTFASHLVMSGVDLNTVRELLGHTSMQMTLRYAHLSPHYRKKAVGVLDQRWAQFGHNTGAAGSVTESPRKKPLKTLTYS